MAKLEAATSAVRKILEKSIKPLKGKAKGPKGPPGPYIMFASQARADLASDATFSSMAATEKLKHIATLWNDLSADEKGTWQAKATEAKAEFTKQAGAMSPLSDAAKNSFPAAITFKDEASVDKRRRHRDRGGQDGALRANTKGV